VRATVAQTGAGARGNAWFDVVELPHRRIGFAAGNGEGGALAAVLRRILRESSLTGDSPRTALERANAALLARRGLPPRPRLAALVGIIDERTATLSYAATACAAPYVVTSDGEATALPSSARRLGAARDLELDDWTFSLPPGSAAVIAAGAPNAAELDDALPAVVAATSSPARTFVERLSANDAAAAIVFSVADDVDDAFRFEFTAVPLAVPLLRRALARYLERCGFSADERYPILLAVGEAAANSVEHAYVERPGVVRVTARRAGGSLVIDVCDRGRWKPAVTRDERGRGLAIMRALMDRIEIRKRDAETSVRLTLRLEGRR
jgi:anti-sigma regulatory factor (Ser/Thr protein kinase)